MDLLDIYMKNEIYEYMVNYDLQEWMEKIKQVNVSFLNPAYYKDKNDLELALWKKKTRNIRTKKNLKLPGLVGKYYHHIYGTIFGHIKNGVVSSDYYINWGCK